MSTDIAWQPQHRDSGSDMGDAHAQSAQQQQPPSQHVQEWDPSAFLNPSMFSSDLLSGSPVTTTPPHTQNLNHFQQDQPQIHHHHQQQQHNVPQLIHPLNHQPPFPQESFQESYMNDPYGQSFDMYHQSDMSRHSFESARYRPSPVQQASDLSPSMAQLGLHQDYLYSATNAFQHQQSQQQNQQHASLPQNLQGHPFDFRQSPTITPNDRASPHPRASPFTVSPVSNHSFAQLQDFSGGPDRRPSTADSVHSLHGEYPSATDFSMTASGGGLNGGSDLGRSHNGIPGVVSSAIHQFNQRNGTTNTSSYHPHLAQDPSSMGMNYGNVLSQPSSSASGPAQHPASAPPGFISQTQPYANHQSSQYAPEQNFHIAPHALDSDVSVAYSSLNGGPPEIANYLRPVLQRYLETRNRIGFGERTVIVMASKVAQKSYGQERRFLCPPPTAIMIGNSWWTESAIGRDDRRAPRVTVSISGESMPPESSVEWTSTSGRPVEPGEAPPETGSFVQDELSAFENGVSAKSQQQQTYIGRAVGKQLFISDDKQKKVEALVKIVAQGGEDEPERVIGVFPSKPIKVISKPSKKRQSAKNMELCINHGSTVSLFHRLRAQTVSTKYLCVSGSGYSFKGSDGAPLPGVEAAHRANTPSFVAKIGTWDPFVIYIVDVTKPQGPDVAPPPPAHPDYPAPPPNAIAITHHGSHIPIYYNQTIVLQCLTSGVVSPVLIIRKVERDTTVVGGGLQEGAKGVPDHFCALGEVCGDPVSQLHKVAFEVYEPNKAAPAPGSAGLTGAFLSCMGDKVNTYRPQDGRTWNYSEMSSRSQSPAVPDSPGASSNGSVTDYFSNGSPLDGSSMDGHGLPPSSDGGRVNSRRGTKRSNTTTSGPVPKATSKARRRVNSVGSNGSGGGYASSTTRGYGIADQSMASGALWSIDIGESAVWTIVGTEQIRYNFFVPPGMPGARASGVPLKPVTPFPNIVKYLPPDRAAENPIKHGGVNRMIVNHGMKADPLAASLVTIYGENFSKTEPPLLFFGTEPSPFVDVRCQEVLACLPPQAASGAIDPLVKMEGGSSAPPQPIFIARPDGVIYPSNVLFYGK